MGLQIRQKLSSLGPIFADRRPKSDRLLGGSDAPANLRAICPVCNEGASNVTLQRPDLAKLLVQVRRATANDQCVLLEWLQKKFGG